VTLPQGAMCFLKMPAARGRWRAYQKAAPRSCPPSSHQEADVVFGSKTFRAADALCAACRCARQQWFFIQKTRFR